MFSVHLWKDTERDKLLLTVSPPHDLCWKTMRKIPGSHWSREMKRWEFPTSAADEVKEVLDVFCLEYEETPNDQKTNRDRGNGIHGRAARGGGAPQPPSPDTW